MNSVIPGDAVGNTSLSQKPKSKNQKPKIHLAAAFQFVGVLFIFFLFIFFLFIFLASSWWVS